MSTSSLPRALEWCVCAAEHDPVAAVVRHSSILDIEMAIVDGVIRKENGRLFPVTVNSKTAADGTKDVEWIRLLSMC